MGEIGRRGEGLGGLPLRFEGFEGKVAGFGEISCVLRENRSLFFYGGYRDPPPGGENLFLGKKSWLYKG